MPYSIAILAPSPVPFQVGGAEKSFWALREALGNLPGCWAELIKLPVGEDTFPDILDGYERFSKLDLTHFDLLVSCKYPAWMAQHPNHVVYMYHTLRGVYDTYILSGSPDKIDPVPPALNDLMSLLNKTTPSRADLPLLFDLARRALSSKTLPSRLFAVPGPLIRQIVHFMDGIALEPAQIKAYYALSHTVARRKDYFPKAAAVQVLSMPPTLTGFHSAGQDYFFTASRLTGSKRLDLLIDAMTYVPGDIPLKIAGVGPEMEQLKKRAAGDKRIEFLGSVSESALIDLYSKALAVPFIPLDEDYGLITVEAFASGKPVITLADSGGPCELIEDGKTGFIVPPEPTLLGKAMSALAANPTFAKEMGQAARRSVEAVTWGAVAATLTQPPKPTSRTARILLVSPYPSDMHGSGGQRRLYHLGEKLSEKYEVILIGFGKITDTQLKRVSLGSHFEEVSLPWPEIAVKTAREMSCALKTSADDLVLSRFAPSCPLLLDTLKEYGAAARGIVLVHPWLVKAVKQALPDAPLIYDAQNVETDLKVQIFGSGELAQEAASLEQEMCESASLILGCSEGDLKRLGELYGTKPARLFPNGCQVLPHRRDRKLLRQRLAYQDAKLVLFIGSGHKPNVEAVLAIFELAASIPEAQFLICGSVCGEPPVIEASRPPNAHLLDVLTEEVKNVILEASDLALNPLTSGSGTNLKIVEYLSAGLPCISTPFGMRGLDHLPGVTVCELQEFGQAIRKALAQPIKTDIMAATASEVCKRFSWSTVFADLCSTVGKSLERAYAASN